MVQHGIASWENILVVTSHMKQDILFISISAKPLCYCSNLGRMESKHDHGQLVHLSSWSSHKMDMVQTIETLYPLVEHSTDVIVEL